MVDKNQNPEQKARDNIDKMLIQAGWRVQEKGKIDFTAGLGIAVREYQTNVGPADYVLFMGLSRNIAISRCAIHQLDKIEL